MTGSLPQTPAETPRPPRAVIAESWRWWALGIALFLMLSVMAAGRLRIEHFVLVGIYVALPWFGPEARRLSVAVTPFAAIGVAYDVYSLVLPYRGAIHVDDLYWADLRWFGVSVDGTKLLLPDYLARFHHPILDAITGTAYITYIAEVFGLAFYFHFKAPERTLMLGVGFVFINLLGWLIWFAWPAAPPWYVAEYGLGPARLDALPSPAGAIRFDQLLSYPLFQSFYARSANVFGAMPSLHCAYPTFTFLAVRDYGPKLRVATASFACLMVFSAMYLQHHYVLDVLAGLATAVVSYFAAKAITRRLTARLSTPVPTALKIP